MTPIRTIAATLALCCAGTACADTPAPQLAAAPAHGAEWQQTKDAIWPLELAIYEGRSRGDLSLYLATTADGYVAWPPFNDVPKGNDGLKATSREMAGKTQERLEMTFLDLALNGDTAVIYYKTHRTSRADGTPVDEHYEVTHTWVRVNGQWKVLGGMARARPIR